MYERATNALCEFPMVTGCDMSEHCKAAIDGKTKSIHDVLLAKHYILVVLAISGE